VSDRGDPERSSADEAGDASARSGHDEVARQLHDAAEASERDRRPQHEAAARTTGLDVVRHAIETRDVVEDRDLTANDRDRLAAARDNIAEVSDEQADARDERAANREESAEFFDAEAASDRVAARRDRQSAAADRVHAQRDREAAAIDRALSARERALFIVDGLTGAHRRDTGIVELDRELRRAKRMRQDYVVAFADVDNLKTRNDELGHAAGDELLCEVVDSIRRHVRAYDLVVRFGGDEFLCGLPDMTIEQAAQRFHHVNEDLQASRNASVTVGLAQLTGDEAVDDLIARADAELYRQRQNRTPPSS
jgi:diguanylate cyclase (GGDEF)-like protein